MSKFGYEDHLKQKHLAMDGFFLFVDLHQPIEQQTTIFHDFYEDLKKCRGGSANVSNIPIAVCIPKVDENKEFCRKTWPNYGRLLERSSWQSRYFDGEPRDCEFFNTNLAERSQACLAGKTGLSHVKKLNAQLIAKGHNCFELFPMASYGMNGLQDLEKQRIDPIGVMEPFIWMLEQKGFHLRRAYNSVGLAEGETIDLKSRVGPTVS